MWESLLFGDVLVLEIPHEQRIILAFITSFMSDIIIILITQFIVLKITGSRETDYIHRRKFSDIIRGRDYYPSLARFQFLLWTLVILFAFFSIYLIRIFNGVSSSPLELPQNLLVLLGISAVVPVISSKVSTVKGYSPCVHLGSHLPYSPSDETTIRRKLPGFRTMFDENGILSLSRVQMFIWTWIAIGIYLYILFSRVINANIAQLLGLTIPDVGFWIIVLMALSQGIYLAGKIIAWHSYTSPENLKKIMIGGFISLLVSVILIFVLPQQNPGNLDVQHFMESISTITGIIPLQVTVTWASTIFTSQRRKKERKRREHFQRLNQALQKWKDLQHSLSNNIPYCSFSPIPLYSDMVSLFEDVNHGKQVIAHIKSEYPKAFQILDNIKHAEDNHNQKVNSFIKDTIDTIEPELKKFLSPSAHNHAIGLLGYRLNGILDHFWEEYNGHHKDLVIRPSSIVRDESTFELSRYKTEDDIAIGNSKTLEYMREAIQNKTPSAKIKLKEISNNIENIEHLIRCFKSKIKSIIEDIDDGTYKGQCKFDRLLLDVKPRIFLIMVDRVPERPTICVEGINFNDRFDAEIMNITIDGKEMSKEMILKWEDSYIFIGMPTDCREGKHKLQVIVYGIESNEKKFVLRNT